MTDILDLSKTDVDTKAEIMTNDTSLKNRLREDAEVLQIVSKIDTRDQVAVLELGKETADGISAFADRILHMTTVSSVNESGALMKHLTTVMGRFDPKDLEEPKGLAKLLGNAKKHLDKLIERYKTMGDDIDKVFLEIRKYEADMKDSTRALEQLYDENYKYFLELEKWVVAIEIKAAEMKEEIPALEARVANGEMMADNELQRHLGIIELLEQRAFDLEMAKQVSVLSAPDIRMLQRGNNKLVAKINSAFVVTIPLFKKKLVQAIHARRQKVVAEGMEELDRVTNDLILQSAKNTANQSVQIARMAGQPSVKLETVQDAWKIIMDGIDETRAIEEENAQNRKQAKIKVGELQAQYQNKSLQITVS